MEALNLTKEIERKFLVKTVPNLLKVKQEYIIQGYLNDEPEIRIRKKSNTYYLTQKGKGDIVRSEEETEINQKVLTILLNLLKGNVIEKTRYQIPLESNLLAELDIYHGILKGLLTVEVEFKNLKEAKTFQVPKWFGKEVTKDQRYRNQNLARCKDIQMLKWSS